MYYKVFNIYIQHRFGIFLYINEFYLFNNIQHLGSSIRPSG